MTNPEPAWLSALLQEATVDYPTTPDFAPSVMAAIRRQPEPRLSLVPSLGLAAAAAVALLVGTLLAVRSTREAIAGFLGLAVEGERIEVLPPPPAGPAIDELPPPLVIEAYADPITLAEAEELIGFAPALPPDLEPAGVYFIRYLPAGWQEAFARPTLVVRYDGFDLWQTSSDSFVGKGLVYDGDAVVTSTNVNGAEAYWITGGPRLVTIFSPSGERLVGSTRTVEANTLVWAAEGRYFRIEGDLELPEALAVAESITAE
jgi:hypothetical protein